MTDGILLNKLASNLWLPEAAIVILDEVHMRGTNQDWIMGLLLEVSRDSTALMEDFATSARPEGHMYERDFGQRCPDQTLHP
jgi:HrpA-like RNA helicase